jgi:hypothetical protein
MWRLNKLRELLLASVENDESKLVQFDQFDSLVSFDSLLGESESYKILSDNFDDGRFIERYYPLMTISPTLSQNILEFARDEYRNELMLENMAPEADVVKAMMSWIEVMDIMAEDKLKGKVMEAKWIVNTLNEGLSEKEKWRPYSVGRIIRRLGFIPARSRSGSKGYIWDKDILEHNIIRYHLEDEPRHRPKTESNRSNESKPVLPGLLFASECV